MKNCRDRLIISSGFQEKGGCPLIRACSVITSNTVSNIIKVSTTANAIKNQMDGPMTKFYVDNWITVLRGSVVRRVFGTHERIVVFGSEHGEYSNTINFRFIEYISESSQP